jgi:uncharacterized protein YaiI (UPF0178 family)
MRILIDADGCPVVDMTVWIAKQNQIECVILCDTTHVFEKDGATTVTVSKGADSVDFALVNMVNRGDIVITQDYGLAAMCLARRAIPISQNGMIFDNSNIDALLLARHTAKKIRNSGGRLKGPKKRTTEQDQCFQETLVKMIASDDRGETTFTRPNSDGIQHF